MPCWYYEKKDLHYTVSRRDGVDEETEARYRREGARFIMDTGTKMGLSFETCATGVVYFHRFYMFHSFRAYHRCVTAACCLFLAGKVEETPKKCKDIIRITKAMLPDSQFAVFGDDPKEEVITLERILLQTIKFDLQVDHPYSWLLKFAKLLKGDKAKVQKMVQMSWTFINDSLCTTLCLQWEPEIIAVALIYLSSRLTKFEIQDWQGRPPHFKGKWWENIVEDVTLELLEDICHQVLDLYSSNPKKKQDSPPPPPPKPLEAQSPHTAVKRPRSPTSQDARRASQGSGGQSQRAKATKVEDSRRTFTPTSRDAVDKAVEKMAVGAVPVNAVSSQSQTVPPLVNTAVPPPSNKHNPYVSSKMFASSFMSQEGSQNIQSLIGGAIPPTAGYTPQAQYAQAPPTVPMAPYPAQQQMAYQQPPTVYQTQTGYQQQQQQAYQPYAQATTQVSYSQPMPAYDASVAATQYTQSGYAGHYTAPAPGYPAQYQAAQPPAQTAQYQAAQPAAQTAQYQAAQPPTQTQQYQAAQPPAQTPQYPAYPPPTQPPPPPINTGAYPGMAAQMQTYNPAHNTAPPRPTNPGQLAIRITGQPSGRNAGRPGAGQALVRITGGPR